MKKELKTLQKIKFEKMVLKKFEDTVLNLFPDCDDEHIRKIFFDVGEQSDSFIEDIIFIGDMMQRNLEETWEIESND